MKCSCGSRCDLLNTRLVVDSIEKEHWCLPCGIRIMEIKDSKGNFTVTEYRGTKPKVTKWNVKCSIKDA